MKEAWKEIKWYENYEVSNLGNIKSLNYNWTWKEKSLKYWKNTSGYLQVRLYKYKKSKMYRVNRLVAIAFIPNPENKPQVNHIDWVKDNNRLENLEWNTISENVLHRFSVLWHKWAHLWKFWKDNPKSKQVHQFSKDWIFIKTWESMMDIQRELWVNNWNISNCCGWKQKTAWGYKWKFKI